MLIATVINFDMLLCSQVSKPVRPRSCFPTEYKQYVAKTLAQSLLNGIVIHYNCFWRSQ